MSRSQVFTTSDKNRIAHALLFERAHVMSDEKSELELLCRLFINLSVVLFSSNETVNVRRKGSNLFSFPLVLLTKVLRARAILTSGSRIVARALAS